MSGPQEALWILIALLSAVSIAALSGYLWRRGGIRGARPLSCAMLVMTAWCLAYAAQLAAVDVESKKTWFLVGDLLTLPAAGVSLWFALEYAGLERLLTRPRVLALVGSMAILAAAYLVNGSSLIWSDLRFDGMVRGEMAPLGVIASAYIFALAVSATGIFVVLFVRSPAHRAPVVLILVGHVSLRVALALEALSLMPVPGVPIAVIALDVTALMYSVALFRFRMFDLLPVARDTIIERMPDGLLVLDAEDRVVDFNAAAQRLLDLPARPPRREPVIAILAGFPALAERIRERAQGPSEASIQTPAGRRVLEIAETPLTDWQHQVIGRLVILHDITALRRVEAQLVEHERALAAAQERERLARELHDGLAQDLWLAKLKATRLAAEPELSAEVQALTGEIASAVDAGIAEARDAVAALRASDSGGRFQDVLERSLQQFEDRFGLRVDANCEPDLPVLSARAEAEVLRIVHEALTNVRRHADATVVRVRAALEDGRFVLEVRDNGRGFDLLAADAGAYGLAGMRERASLIGGELTIESALHRGATVRLLVPVSVDPPLVPVGVP